MKVAVIGGTGSEGFALAARWARAGVPVIIGSRSAERASAAARSLNERSTGARAEGLINHEAAGAAEVVVLTLPFAAQPVILPELKEAVAGKVVVDATVPLRSVRPPVLEIPPEGSAAQRAQALLGDAARLVAAFHTVSAHLLQRPDAPVEGDVLMAGDDDLAKQLVARELVRPLGMRGFDAGPLSNASTLERLAALVVELDQRYRRRSIGIRLTGV